MQPGQARLTAGGRVLVGTVPTVIFPVAQLLGLHTRLVLAVVLPLGAAGLGVWEGEGQLITPAPRAWAQGQPF